VIHYFLEFKGQNAPAFQLYSQKTQSQLQHSFNPFQNSHQPVEETKVPAKARDYQVLEIKQMQSGTHIDRQQKEKLHSDNDFHRGHQASILRRNWFPMHLVIRVSLNSILFISLLGIFRHLLLASRTSSWLQP
jgi:hypothetical protein